jgi:hypothetical protein
MCRQASMPAAVPALVTVGRIVGAEAWRLRPDVQTVDHLFIVPPSRSVPDSLASR